jgi:peptidoglycan-associated lipoprotein
MLKTIKYIVISCFLISCGMSNKINSGKMAFDLKRYDLSIDLFKQEIKDVKDNVDKSFIYYHTAMAYDKLNKYPEAIENYGLAQNAGYGYLATYKKAYALKKLMMYKQAAAAFESLSNVPEIKAETGIQKNLCLRFAAEALSRSRNVNIEDFLPKDNYSHYHAVNYDDNFLVFTSDADNTGSSETYEWTGRKFSDIVLADKASGSMIKFDTEINSSYNDGTPAFNKDYNLMVFTRCFNNDAYKNDFCKLMMSRRLNGLWSKPILLDFVVDEVNYTHPCFFENDSILIFSAKPKGKDQYDLYYAEWDGETYVEPYPLPESINSSYNEFFPIADGDTLYFSSDNIKGYGGLDIYKTYLNNKGTWASPVILDYPYNTGADDMSLLIDRKSSKAFNVLEQGYFSSSRSNDGLDKIYKYKILKSDTIKKIEEVVVIDTVKKNNFFDLYLIVKVLDGKTRMPISNSALEIKLEKSELKGLTNKNGLYLSKIDLNNKFYIKVNKNGYLSRSIDFFEPLNNITSKSYTINKEILLDSLEKGKEFVLENIYYDYDKWDIKNEALPSLNKLVQILKDNPKINIELGAHTDCRGEEDYNEILSQKRAQSAVNFLVASGIEVSRLSAKGYGESLPTQSCECTSCTEEQHQINRRTSFRIL